MPQVIKWLMCFRWSISAGIEFQRYEMSNSGVFTNSLLGKYYDCGNWNMSSYEFIVLRHHFAAIRNGTLTAKRDDRPCLSSHYHHCYNLHIAKRSLSAKYVSNDLIVARCVGRRRIFIAFYCCTHDRSHSLWHCQSSSVAPWYALSNDALENCRLLYALI